ncbi:MAG: ferredoxin:thioredoxin reductase [Methanomicrobiales archaeon]|nr:ferredoxin:thioredoxin reductase [Methanomicrobiales archaeon]
MTEDQEAEEAMLRWARKYAKEKGWMLNPDRDKLRVVIRGLARNRKRFGEQYCPCRIRSGDAEKDRAIICPCAYHEDEVAREGQCHCRLYFAGTGSPPETHR